MTDTCDISVGRRESHAIETKGAPYKYVVTDTCDISVGRRESHAIETKELLINTISYYIVMFS